MKFVLAASALAIIATSTQAQTTTPQPAPGPIAVAKASPAPRQPMRRTIARKRVNPVVARVALANRAATLEPQAQGFVNAVQIFPFSDGTIYQVRQPGRCGMDRVETACLQRCPRRPRIVGAEQTPID